MLIHAHNQRNEITFLLSRWWSKDMPTTPFSIWKIPEIYRRMSNTKTFRETRCLEFQILTLADRSGWKRKWLRSREISKHTKTKVSSHTPFLRRYWRCVPTKWRDKSRKRQIWDPGNRGSNKGKRVRHSQNRDRGKSWMTDVQQRPGEWPGQLSAAERAQEASLGKKKGLTPYLTVWTCSKLYWEEF